jgi:hypothetical protein
MRDLSSRRSFRSGGGDVSEVVAGGLLVLAAGAAGGSVPICVMPDGVGSLVHATARTTITATRRPVIIS